MNTTKEKAVELGKQIATSTYTNRHYLDRTVYTFNFEALHTLVNAAIDLYKSDPKTNTSQERVHETAKSEQVPLTDEQKLAMLKADSYFHQRESYLQGIEDAEKHHGIGGKKCTN